MWLDLAGGDVGAQVGAREDARILSPGQVEGDNMVWGSLYYARLQDLGYKTQDSTMQDKGDGSKWRIQK